MNKLLKKITVGMAAVGAMVLGSAVHAADFDATSTTEIVNTALGNVTPTLKAGIIAVVGVGLGIWAIFFLIGKLRKHVR